MNDGPLNGHSLAYNYVFSVTDVSFKEQIWDLTDKRIRQHVHWRASEPSHHDRLEFHIEQCVSNILLGKLGRFQIRMISPQQLGNVTVTQKDNILPSLE